MIDSYAWHQRSWEAFPGRDGERRDFLTRLDEIEGGFRFLILSPRQPVRPIWCPEKSWFSKAIPESFLQYKSYEFSVLVNPTRKVRSAKDGKLLKNSRRVPLATREQQVDWFQRKGQQHGFEPDERLLRIVQRPRQIFNKSGSLGTHSVVEFAGILRVTEKDAFTRAIFEGIGPAKAFGLGMLCLLPIQ